MDSSEKDQPTVGSYNVHDGFGLDWRWRPGRNLEVVAELNTDIVVLQEIGRRFSTFLFSPQGSDTLEAIGYEIVPLDIQDWPRSWFGNVILARAGATMLHRAKGIPLPSLEARGAVIADLHARGLDLRVVGTHLGLLGGWRERQTRAILDHLVALEGRPTLILGDLNEWNLDAACLRHFARQHHVAPLGASFHTRYPTLSLDRIIASEDLAFEDAGVHASRLARVASDHLPVWARVKPAN